jgi:hypothetical protein
VRRFADELILEDGQLLWYNIMHDLPQQKNPV